MTSGAEGGFTYRLDPIAEPRETFRVRVGQDPKAAARHEERQAARQQNTESGRSASREHTLPIRTIFPVVEIPEVK